MILFLADAYCVVVRRGDTVLDHTVILKWLIWEKEGVRCAGEKVVQVSETQVHPLSHSSMRDRGGNLFVQRKSKWKYLLILLGWILRFRCGWNYDSINPKGNQPWILTGRTDAEAEAPILWPLDANSWLTGKDPDAGKDGRQKVKRATEDEMVGWHHRLDEHEFEQTLRDSEGQGSLVCCSPWGSQRVGHNLITEQHYQNEVNE